MSRRCHRGPHQLQYSARIEPLCTRGGDPGRPSEVAFLYAEPPQLAKPSTAIASKQDKRVVGLERFQKSHKLLPAEPTASNPPTVNNLQRRCTFPQKGKTPGADPVYAPGRGTPKWLELVMLGVGDPCCVDVMAASRSARKRLRIFDFEGLRGWSHSTGRLQLVMSCLSPPFLGGLPGQGSFAWMLMVRQLLFAAVIF